MESKNEKKTYFFPTVSTSTLSNSHFSFSFPSIISFPPIFAAYSVDFSFNILNSITLHWDWKSECWRNREENSNETEKGERTRLKWARKHTKTIVEPKSGVGSERRQRRGSTNLHTYGLTITNDVFHACLCRQIQIFFFFFSYFSLAGAEREERRKQTEMKRAMWLVCTEL